MAYPAKKFPANYVLVTGDTFPVKERIKALSEPYGRAVWDGVRRGWQVPPEAVESVRALVSGKTAKTAIVGECIEPSAAVAAVLWSAEQQAIFAWFAKGVGNLVVQARAGTGKTTTIKEAFTHAPEASILYAVFNKKNQVEAQEKIVDARVKVKTLHSLGFWFIKSVWGNAKPDDCVEADRLASVSKDLPEEVSSAVLKLVGFAKNLTVSVPDVAAVVEIADARNIAVPDGVEESFPVSRLAALAIGVLRASLVRDASDRVSFNDMVWLPVAAGWVKPTFALVVVDEAQDMNAPQLTMAERACLKTGRICIVGDDRQAIYGFRGAASDGMGMMKSRLNASSLGLTTTYRCPKSVVALANSIVPDYVAAPAAPDGQIIDLPTSEAIKSLVVGDAVLSRLNAPLMSIALSLLRKGTPARIEGRDIGRQLVGMVRKLRAKSVPDFFRKLTSWGDKQKNRILASGGKYASSKAELIDDQVMTLAAVAEDCGSIAEIESKIVSLFEDSERTSKPAVVCSSVHKAKGLEWNKVCVIEDSFKNKTDGEESNIYYVAITRTKQTLVRASGRADIAKQS